MPPWLLAVAEPAIFAVLLLYLLYQFLLSHVEGDQAYLLYAAQQVLNGVQLDGPRLIETNPPLIVWFSEIAALLGRVLHLDAVLSLRLVVLAMLASSAAWGHRLLRVAGVSAQLGRHTARTLWAATFLLITVTQPAEFGQREQLLLALLLPYLLAVGTDAVDRLRISERLVLGVCAGLAVCFKPQHLLTIACLQLFLVLYRRSLARLLTVEIAAAVTTGLVYVAAVRLFTPAYLQVITPLLRSTYWALGEYTFAQMAFHVGRGMTLVCIAAGVAWYFLRHKLSYAQLSGALLASGVGAVLAYFQQHTGWYHQRFTAVALLGIAAVWMAADLLRSDNQKQARAWHGRIAWMAFPLCASVLFAAVYSRKQRAAAKTPDLTSELAALPAGTTVYAFSVGLNAFPVVLERDLRWGSRFAHLWMLPAIRANEVPSTRAGHPFHFLTPERSAELAGLQRRETTEDLQRTHPEVIFVERCAEVTLCESYTSPFDAVQWFSQDSAFAQLWSQYHFVKAVSSFDEYRLVPQPWQ